ncbi:hypothetical protein MMC17_003172 [Xylographa soralifera]|nr:hypothetical protein [Xylographa soralifera]
MSSSVVPDPNDRADFKNAIRGLIKPLSPCTIYTANGDTCWDSEPFSFLNTEDELATVNSSLKRQSQLCLFQGLFNVTEGIYQVRGLDLSNISFVETDTNVIVIDPLISKECAQKALELYQDHRPGRSVIALIYTHSHDDHFGGAEAIVPSKDPTSSTYTPDPTFPIYAPDGFLDHAVNENVYAGTAMTRRSMYMYGDELDKCATGQVGAGLGMTASTGSTTLIAPTSSDIITTSPCTRTIDGLEVTFQLTPGTEAPSEMNFYFPKYKALCMAENVTHTLHNIQTLRGALVRDAHEWSIYIDEAMGMFGNKTDVVFSSHHWPTWNDQNDDPNEPTENQILTFMTRQRDMYAFLNDQTLRKLNDGMVGTEIAEDLKLPETLAKCWHSQGYYGSISHNVKAIYHRYLGWFDGNPAHLWEHPPVDSATRYVKCMGGASAVIDKAKEYADNKDYRFAATLLNHVVFADPTNADPVTTDAKTELGGVYTQLGYLCENGTWRNFYLTGAQELESGPVPPNLALDPTQAAMALELNQLMDTMAVRLEGLAAQYESFSIDWYVYMTTYLRQDIRLTLSNGALTNHARIPDQEPEGSADLTCTLSRQDLVGLVIDNSKTIEDNPDIKYQGNPDKWTTLTGYLRVPIKGFAIVTPD